MEKKEVMIMNLTPGVAEMEGARRATGFPQLPPCRDQGRRVLFPIPRFRRKQAAGIIRQSINVVSSGRPQIVKSKDKLAPFCAEKVYTLPI